jgi:hypothetical protein
MTTRGYTILGWVVWQIGSRIVKRKLGAAGVVLLVVGGILAGRAARAGRDE